MARLRDLVSLAELADPDAADEPVPGFPAWLTVEGRAEVWRRYPIEARHLDERPPDATGRRGVSAAFIVKAVLGRTAVFHSPDDQTTCLAMRKEFFVVDLEEVRMAPRADLDRRERARRGRENRRPADVGSPPAPPPPTREEIGARLVDLFKEGGDTWPAGERFGEVQSMVVRLVAAEEDGKHGAA